jgi:hypothetical protein
VTELYKVTEPVEVTVFKKLVEVTLFIAGFDTLQAHAEWHLSTTLKVTAQPVYEHFPVTELYTVTELVEVTAYRNCRSHRSYKIKINSKLKS